VVASCQEASECHPNLLVATIYNKESANYELVQSLVLDKLHYIIVSSYIEEEFDVVEVGIVQMVNGPEASQCTVLQSIGMELIGEEDLE
jgi:hypothetical protein